jgi:hypothetical protein
METNALIEVLCNYNMSIENDSFQYINVRVLEAPQHNAYSSFWPDLVKNLITIVLALIAGFIALYQMKSNIISSARIRWIEQLRESLSNLYPNALNVFNAYEMHIIYQDRADAVQSNLFYGKYLQHLSDYNSLSAKIKMQLNSNEPEHKSIEDILDEVDEKINQAMTLSVSLEGVDNDLLRILNHSKNIFKLEWEKSKKIFKI